MDINRILEILPHRYPFLLVDRILEMREGFVVGQKCVTMNEWFFQGHFPQQPVMPGVLILEAMAQTGAILAHLHEENRGRLIFLAGVDDARFRKVISPGDVLRIEMTEIQRRKNIGRCSGRVLVDGKLACEAVLTFAVQASSQGRSADSS
ncbi:MAG: 3-hydroxyacyl-ACP dehydratase FabZ [Candidatus Sumerlaeaceae bacterium]